MVIDSPSEKRYIWSLFKGCTNKLPLIGEVDLETVQEVYEVTVILPKRFTREIGYYRDSDGIMRITTEPSRNMGTAVRNVWPYTYY